MSSEQKAFLKKSLVKYFKSLDIELHTQTKARGHQGFFFQNRIDISKNIKEERIIPTLLHEFAHYIHAKLESDIAKSGGSLEILFDLEELENRKQKIEAPKYAILSLFDGFSKRDAQAVENVQCIKNLKSEQQYDILGNYSIKTIEKELLSVTNFVDEHSHNHKLLEHKDQIKKKIKMLEGIIKQDYPKFMRSKKFKEFDKYIKKSKARYLLRFDRVKFVSPSFLGLMKKFEIFSIENLEQDFPEMPPAFCAYIRLKSAQKKQKRISARINKLNKYYSKPTELFARFVEGIYIDEARTRACAPIVTQRFFELLNKGYYLELKKALEIIECHN